MPYEPLWCLLCRSVWQIHNYQSHYQTEFNHGAKYSCKLCRDKSIKMTKPCHYAAIKTSGSKSYFLNLFQGSLLLILLCSPKQLDLRVFALSLGHSFPWPGQIWMWVSVSTENKKWCLSGSPPRHEFIQVCAGELAGMERTVKPSLLSPAWVESRYCLIWLISATCTGFSNSPVFFRCQSLWILDLLFRFFAFFAQISLSNLEYVCYFITCITCSCKMLVNYFLERPQENIL